ncbi:hypothetical protein CLV62_10697 [Dysgonomonas alginatilytica]|uniref:Uncharacterized protein n=1 Tax=Dysgonomonas alginatilytica TaxID=1605892 RepID=A0A2V3PS54_9BACT|nr:hypothetical protein [Dysgonomonas alginatilytica]PXV65924.1 hypothetical protein CLV62_10697 [Dysgonomonas alginatilytica]
MRYIIVCLFSFFLLNSCSSGKITTTETTPTHAIVFGRLNIYKDKSIKTQDIWIHFNERNWGKTVARLDEEGYFAVKVPIGKNHITMLDYGNKYHNLPKDCITINIENSEIVYYIGNIYINWSPNHGNERVHSGIIGHLAENSRDGNCIAADVKSTEFTVKRFKRLFPENEKEIEVKLITIK